MFPPGESFSYCNSGYVILALIAERAADTTFPQLVADRVAEPDYRWSARATAASTRPSPISAASDVHRFPARSFQRRGATSISNTADGAWPMCEAAPQAVTASGGIPRAAPGVRHDQRSAGATQTVSPHHVAAQVG